MALPGVGGGGAGGLGRLTVVAFRAPAATTHANGPVSGPAPGGRLGSTIESGVNGRPRSSVARTVVRRSSVRAKREAAGAEPEALDPDRRLCFLYDCRR